MKNEAVVVGAGLCGLTIAHRLRSAGIKALVLEKSRGVGGRLATRRTEEACFDHGAQFYRPSPDVIFGRGWRESGAARFWFREDGVDHFAAPGGMTRLAKAIARPEEIKLNTKVTALARENGGWVITTETESYFSPTLYLTCPLPQSLALLSSSGIPAPPELESLTYTKALVGLCQVENLAAPNNFHFRQYTKGAILSVANQWSKGTSPNPAFTFVMSPQWSESHFEDPEEQILEAMHAQLIPCLKEIDPGARIGTLTLKKWRYCQPLKQSEKLYCHLEEGLYLGGDAFGGASVAGAIRSGSAVPLPAGP